MEIYYLSFIDILTCILAKNYSKINYKLSSTIYSENKFHYTNFTIVRMLVFVGGLSIKDLIHFKMISSNINLLFYTINVKIRNLITNLNFRHNVAL